MEVVFKSNKIKKQVKQKVLSDSIANRRLRQLADASCYLDIPTSAKAHFLQGNLKRCFAVDFHYPSRLICEPIGEYKKEKDQFIKETIMSIEISKVETDYH